MNSKTVTVAIAFIAAFVGVGWWLFAPGGNEQNPTAASDAVAVAQGSPMVEVQVPETLSGQAQIGQRGFEGLCAQCHGENAAGRQGIGPALVHRIYEPSHHADAAFLLAAQNGVRAHHWNFGNMPPVEGVTRADVMAITAYVRELQRANGIN
ncbi:cytochrome c [Rhodobacteraceae bacterium N5(2021)]|jgi:mono/diheme cytochrome c family protein|uniref:Cytochrome c n=1 Tax=Gymnodinialimonas phycosphaerae TaxID=2841589 RepID=A0A975YG09_9RHOB|nr:cytochrome c [Gymnodinialimonas phycosphaerae]MBY4891165.1 cytochrome c [Gymnodinialimonas phycosphaerae]